MTQSNNSKPSALSSSQKSTLTQAVAPHAPLLKAITQNGGNPFLVGGAVRDILIGYPLKDLDLEVYGLSYKTLNAILAPFEFKGLSRYGVFQNGSIEIALPRVEKQTKAGYHGFETQLNPHLPFKVAAARRDLTINAMGIHLENNTLLDPFGGRLDARNHCLTPIDTTRFVEDPLRLLRTAQLIARLDFIPSPALLSCQQKMNVKDLSFKKRFMYCLNILNAGPHLENALAFLQKSPHWDALPFINQLDATSFSTKQFMDLREKLTNIAPSKDLTTLAALVLLARSHILPFSLSSLALPAGMQQQIEEIVKNALMKQLI